MNRYIFLILLLLGSFSYSQYSIAVDGGMGTYLYNSENSMKSVMGEKFTFLQSYGISVQCPVTPKSVLTFTYDYTKATVPLTLIYQKAGLNMFYDAETAYDLVFEGQHFTVQYKFPVLQNLSFNWGPVIGITTREYFIETSLFEDSENVCKIDDRLVSYCGGTSASLEYSTPIAYLTNCYFLGTFKVRYEHAFAFSARGRDLSDYYQDFLTIQGNIGIGIKL